MTMNEITPELIEKAKGAKSAEELLKMAVEAGIELTAEAAQRYFEQLNPAMGELDDDELDNVSGGGCGRREAGDREGWYRVGRDLVYYGQGSGERSTNLRYVEKPDSQEKTSWAVKL